MWWSEPTNQSKKYIHERKNKIVPNHDCINSLVHLENVDTKKKQNFAIYTKTQAQQVEKAAVAKAHRKNGANGERNSLEKAGKTMKKMETHGTVTPF